MIYKLMVSAAGQELRPFKLHEYRHCWRK